MTSSRSANERDELIDALASRRHERLDQALADIASTARQIIEVDRVSIWLFTEDLGRIKRIHTEPEVAQGQLESRILNVAVRPEYRQALEATSMFRLADRSELSMRAGDELYDYLQAAGVAAILDGAIVLDGMLRGVLCLEHREPRPWSTADRREVSRLADITGAAIAVDRRLRSHAIAARFRVLIEASVDAIGMAAPDGTLEYLNPAARRMLGLVPDEPVHGRVFSDVLVGPSPERVREVIVPIAREQGSWTGPVRLAVDADRAGQPASIFDATATISAYRGATGHVEYLSCRIREPSDQIEAEQRIAEVRSRYEASLAGTGDILFHVDFETLLISDGRRSLGQLLGYAGDAVSALTLADISVEGSDDVRARVERALADGHLLCGERQLRSADGGCVDIDMAMIGQDDGIGQTVAVRVRNIGELVARRREIERLAFYDPLTGLANGNLLRDRAESMLSRAIVDDRRVGFILFQIARWQRIFDTQGYQIAEAVIQQLGQRFKDLFADYNVTVSRLLGGAEFGILFDADINTDEELVARAHAVCAQPFRADGDTVVLHGHSGSAAAPQHAINFKDLTKRAGIALRHAGSSNLQHARFDPSYSGRISDEHLIEEDLRDAIGTPQLTLSFQPIRHAAHVEAWWGAESLVRWQHPTLGCLTPDDFIPIAEESQLIVALDEFILTQATRLAMTWPSRMQDMTLTVNISAVTLMSVDLMALLQKVLGQTGFPAERLCLEVTETSVMLDLAGASTSLARAHEMGVSIALDDFGTGFSSLAYLKDLPVDLLKIDRDFIRGIGSDHRDERAIETIVALGHDLNIRVIAEGVETSLQLAWLVDRGIDYMQGFHIALPMSNDNLILTPPARDTWND